MAKAKQEAAREVQEWMYQVVRRPIFTEKSTLGSQNNEVTFEVNRDATKPEIKAAVEALFSVTVERVNTVTLHGKTKIFRGRKGERSDMKKAIVKLAAGQTIDVASGV